MRNILSNAFTGSYLVNMAVTSSLHNLFDVAKMPFDAESPSAHLLMDIMAFIEQTDLMQQKSCEVFLSMRKISDRISRVSQTHVTSQGEKF